jgi:hypothetical protein
MTKRNTTEQPTPPNLLDLKPVRRVTWEDLDDGRVVLLVPKFTHRFWVKWLVPRLRKPHFRVRLDEYGSLVWKHCDGETSVSEIAEAMRERFGDRAEPLHDRLVVFIRRLERGDLIDVPRTA